MAAGQFTVDDVHAAFDGLGMLPVAGSVIDLVHGVWYVVEGDVAGGGITIIAAIPIGGDVIAAIRANSRARVASTVVGEVAYVGEKSPGVFSRMLNWATGGGDGVGTYYKVGDKYVDASKAGMAGMLPNKQRWPKEWMSKDGVPSRVSAADIAFGCENDALKTQKAIGGGSIIRIDANPALGVNRIGRVKSEMIEEGFVSDWGYHVAVEKDGKIYDRLTGPDGMSHDDYFGMFDYPGDLVVSEYVPKN